MVYKVNAGSYMPKKKIDIDKLSEYTSEELKELWGRKVKDRKCPNRKSLIVKELAYYLQAKEYGDLDKNTKVTIARRIRTLENNLKNNNVNKKEINPEQKIVLKAGTKLTKEYRNQVIQVEVIGEREFQCKNETFKSLSAVAKHITGQHMSGVKFFNLK